MRIYDITLTLRPGMPVWPGDPTLHIDRVSRIEDGDVVNVTKIDMCAHTGTHVDAPYHFLAGGLPVEQLPLDTLVGPAVVVELLPTSGHISAQDLQRLNLIDSVERILFKTPNSKLWKEGESSFRRDFVALDESAATWLVEHGVRLVGIDYLSIAPFQAPSPVHLICLQAGMVVLEGVDLSEVPPGAYELYCLPMKLAAADGAPARVILVDRELNGRSAG